MPCLLLPSAPCFTSLECHGAVVWKLLAPCALPALRQGGAACCLSCSPVVAQCALPTLRQGGAVYCLCASCHSGGTMCPTHPEGRWCSILLLSLSRARATPVTSPPGANQTTTQVFRLLSQGPILLSQARNFDCLLPLLVLPLYNPSPIFCCIFLVRDAVVHGTVKHRKQCAGF